MQTGKRTDVFLLKLASDVALDKSGLTGTTIADKHKLPTQKSKRREARSEKHEHEQEQCSHTTKQQSHVACTIPEPKKKRERGRAFVHYLEARALKLLGRLLSHVVRACVAV